MKLHELAEACAVCLKNRADIDFDPHGYIALVAPRGTRLPFKGRLACENAEGNRVYYVRVHQIFQYLARATKPEEGGR